MSRMMTLGEASSLFATETRIKALKRLIADRKTLRVALAGLKGSSAALLLGKLADRKRPMVIVADDADSAGYLYHDLSRVAESEVGFFPSGYKRHIKYGRIDAPQQILRAETLDGWRHGRLSWVVTYPDALAERVPVRKELEDNTLQLSTTRKADIGKVEERLEQLGFTHVDYVYEPGQFARRGSILDVFSYSNELPYRIDFFDDEIDSIRTFNVETQLSEQRLGEVSIIPASAAEGKGEHGVSLLEFIGKETVLFVADTATLTATVRDIAAQQYSESAAIAEEGDPDAMQKVVDPEDFASRLSEFRIFEFGMAAKGSGADAVMRFDTSPQALYHKNFDIISESFTQMISDGYRLLILSDSAYQGERLKEIFADRGDRIDFTPVSETIHAGFVDHETRICFFTDHQIFDRFHKYSLKSDKARSGKLALSLKELNQIEVGDYIVHIDHGIGKFAGLIKTDTNGSPQEMIKHLYQNDEMILVSIHSL
ncbi:MAG: transcription-repair coupling factor, partial [Muribaculaceae bacterium]|nr:transcription-repair coupling factor [Muribaculaceae bacterium]